MNTSTLAIAAIAACLAAGLAHAAPAVRYIAPGGDDAWSGKLAQPNRAGTDGPFATLERARLAARELAAKPGVSGVTIQLAPGEYRLSAPVVFGPEDSGSATCPIEYRAERTGTARILGGPAVGGWQPVSDPAALARLAPEAREQVRVADLTEAGVGDLQGINSPQTYVSDPGLEVFLGDRAMTLARYPNEGWIRITEVLDGGRFRCDDPRVAEWSEEPEVWLHGFWYYDWADLRVPLQSVEAEASTLAVGDRLAGGYGIRAGQWFLAQNLLRELDSPGEWWLDRATAKLYLWPPEPLDDTSVTVSVVRDPIVLEGASHVAFRGLTVEAARGTAFTLRGGSDVRIVGCTIRNMGNWAVRVLGGERHGVVGCDITATGQGGIYLDGGDRKSLTPAGHYADNNHVHHTSRWDPVYQQAIALRGVGNRATHNLIDNVPHIAIGFSDNEMTIEYNEIHSSVYQSNDAGAIYTSPPDETWSMRGHRIRHNYLHNLHGFEGRGVNGVYLDDCFSSADISQNVFYDVANAVLIGGGRDNRLTDNMFVQCGRAFHIDARGLGWAASVGTFATEELRSLNWQQPPWSTRYPELLGILDDDPLAPKGNVVARNILWGGAWGWTEPAAEPLVRFESNLIDVDPRFVGEPSDGFRLAPDSPARKLLFRMPDFPRIGLYASPDRASWPVTSELRK